MSRTETERALAETARRVMPGGDLGNMPSDIIIARGKAGRVWDVSGNEYVDYLLGSGPMLVGHAHPEVTRAVTEQVAQGSTFFAANPHAIQLAEAIVEAIPCAEQVRFCSTGTEADAYAMRLARAFRRRSKILKFEGGYHGMSDWGLMSIWPRTPTNSGRPQSDTAGTPDSLLNEMLVAPYNDLEAARALIHAHRDELAGVIVEPMQRLIPPAPGFLEGLRAITAEHGIVLIFDEVVTGFRLAYGGAQEYFGVVPDLATLGKVVGGGYPLSAIAGRADIMAHFDREKAGEAGFLPQVGTLSGNPVAAVAGLATLAILKRPGAYARIFANGRALWEGIGQALKEAGLTATLLGLPCMFDALFTPRAAVTDYRGMAEADAAMARRLNGLLRRNGVFKNEGKLYVAMAHDERDIADTIAAYRAAAQEMARTPLAA